MLLQHVIVHNTLYMQCVTENGVFLICYHNIIDILVILIISAYGLLLGPSRYTNVFDESKINRIR